MSCEKSLKNQRQYSNRKTQFKEFLPGSKKETASVACMREKHKQNQQTTQHQCNLPHISNLLYKLI